MGKNKNKQVIHSVMGCAWALKDNAKESDDITEVTCKICRRKAYRENEERNKRLGNL